MLGKHLLGNASLRRRGVINKFHPLVNYFDPNESVGKCEHLTELLEHLFARMGLVIAGSYGSQQDASLSCYPGSSRHCNILQILVQDSYKLS